MTNTGLQLAPAVEPEAQTAAVEPFEAVAGRAAESLAALVDHPDCPPGLFHQVEEFMADLSNEHGNLAMDIRARFGPLAMAAAGEERIAA